MGNLVFPSASEALPPERKAPGRVLVHSEAAYAYQRVKEFLGYTIDDIVEREEARHLVRDLYRVHFLIKNPHRLARLPRLRIPDSI